MQHGKSEERSYKDVRFLGAYIYDSVEEYDNCTVQVLQNSYTGDVSWGWKKNRGCERKEGGCKTCLKCGFTHPFGEFFLPISSEDLRFCCKCGGPLYSSDADKHKTEDNL